MNHRQPLTTDQILWMWLILLLVLIGSALTLVSLLLRSSSTDNAYSIRRGIGIALIAVSVLCLVAGFAGHSHSKSRMNVFVNERNITDPEVIEVANREARVPLEASVVPGVVFLGFGLLAARRRGS